MARALSKLGYCSRARAAELIRAGRVRLNGAVPRDPEAPTRLESDRIEVDGAAVGAREHIYLMMNKPRGVVTTASDEKGRPTVYSVLLQGLKPAEQKQLNVGATLPLSGQEAPTFGTAEAVPHNPGFAADSVAAPGACPDPVGRAALGINDTARLKAAATQPKPRSHGDSKAPNLVCDVPNDFEGGWVAPVGRLDKASEGLLLFTNDSEWAARIADPASHLDKTYHVQVAAREGEGLARQLVRGVSFGAQGKPFGAQGKHAGGELLRAKQARVLRAGQRNSWLEIVLDEGKNRHIRRMFNHLGIEVLRLVRVAIGPLALGDLPKGKFRALDPAEKRALDRALQNVAAPRALI